MAIVIYGPLITGARGSVAGVTFSNTHSGQTARNRPRPPLPQKPQQLARQLSLATIAGLWRSLTQAQRDGWEQYAATVTFTNSLGQPYTITGFQHFVRIRSYLASLGPDFPGPFPSDRPSNDGLPTPPVASIVVIPPPGSGTLDLILLNPPLQPNQWFCWSAFYATTRTLGLLPGPFANRSAIDDGFVLPVPLAQVFRPPYQLGLPLTVHTHWRFYDEFSRLSALIINRTNFLQF